MQFLVSKQAADVPRWLAAFPEGQHRQSIAQHSSDTQVIWLHTGLANWQQVLKQAKDTAIRVVVLSNVPQGSESKVALALGAKGYAHAWASAATLQQIAVVIEHGGIWLDPDLMSRLIETSAGLGDALAPDLLTEREWQVARLVGQGLANKVIAQSLDITERTVKAHLSSIFEKTHCKDRFQLAIRVNSTP